MQGDNSWWLTHVQGDNCDVSFLNKLSGLRAQELYIKSILIFECLNLLDYIVIWSIVAYAHASSSIVVMKDLNLWRCGPVWISSKICVQNNWYFPGYCQFCYLICQENLRTGAVIKSGICLGSILQSILPTCQLN